VIWSNLGNTDLTYGSGNHNFSARKERPDFGSCSLHLKNASISLNSVYSCVSSVQSTVHETSSDQVTSKDAVATMANGCRGI